MAKKLLLGIAVIVFVLSSSLASGERSADLGTGSQLSLCTDRDDLSPNSNQISALFGRLLRAKSIKTPASVIAATREIGLAAWIKDPAFSPHPSKYGVYQQIGVYRL